MAAPRSANRGGPWIQHFTELSPIPSPDCPGRGSPRDLQGRANLLCVAGGAFGHGIQAKGLQAQGERMSDEAGWVRAAASGYLAEGDVIGGGVGGRDIPIYHLEGEFFAT